MPDLESPDLWIVIRVDPLWVIAYRLVSTSTLPMHSVPSQCQKGQYKARSIFKNGRFVRMQTTQEQRLLEDSREKFRSDEMKEHSEVGGKHTR